MIVEFIGLPASGKTTIARKIHLQEIVESKRIKYPLYKLYKYPWLIRNLVKSFSVIKYIIVNPIKSIRLYMAVFKTKQESLVDLIKVYFNYLFFIANYVKYKKSNDIILFDEGLLHNIWAILYASKKNIGAIELKKFVVNNCVPDIVVEVHCEEEIMINRLFIRSSNTRLEKEGNIENKVRESVKEIEHIVNYTNSISNNFNINFVRIDNSNDVDLDLNVQNIVSFIRERIESDDRNCNS